MIRVFVTSALLFLLPFVLFAIYATVTDFLTHPDEEPKGGKPKSAWTNPPLVALTAIGSILVLGTLIYLALTSSPGGAPGGTYHPPTVKDGKIQPGYVD